MAITLELVAGLIIDLLSAAIAVEYMDLCFGRKYPGWKGLLCLVAGGAVYFALLKMNHMVRFQLLMGLGYGFVLAIYGIFCLKGCFWEKAAMAFLWVFMAWASSWLVWRILLAMTGMEWMEPGSARWDMQLYGSVSMLILKYAFGRLGAMALRRVKGVRQGRDRWMVVFSYLMLFFLVLGVFSLEVGGLKGARKIYLLACLQVGLFGIVVCLAYFYHRMMVYHWKNQQLEFDRERLKRQEEYIDNLGRLCHEMHLLRHDLSGRLEVVCRLVAKGQDQEALDYMKKLGNQVASLGELPEETGNRGLDTVLMKTGQECREKGIDFSHIICKEVEKIDSMDMGILFYNLLNNAVEACDKAKDVEKEIRLLISGNGRRMICTLENSIGESVLAKNPKLETCKGDSSCHGFGVQSIRKIVENHGGTYKYWEEGSLFVQEILLPYGGEEDPPHKD